MTGPTKSPRSAATEPGAKKSRHPSTPSSADIKWQVPIKSILKHYGSVEDSHGRHRCIRPDRHHNGDIHHSLTVQGDRAFCWSQGCLGDSGMDIFELVGLMESLDHLQGTEAPRHGNWRPQP
jgi:hypothetical protein